jgi:nicotinate phosphoribosyltransferase
MVQWHEPIITSLLDTDLYKLTMLQAYYHAPEFRSVEVEWKFDCRNPTDKHLARLVPDLKHQIELLCGLHFTRTELVWLSGLSFIKPDFIEFLRLFRLNPRYVILTMTEDGFDLRLRGPLIHVMLFEIYLLAIISELHTELNIGGVNEEEGRRRIYSKIEKLREYPDHEDVKIAEFGTRRRASKEWHYTVLDILKHEIPQSLVGTSNLYLARELDLTPIGTMAHEWFQAWQAIGPRLRDAQIAALEGWVHEYRGELGIALTDCYNMQSFCRDFDLYFGKLYDGLRHDSGCPFEWGEKAIDLYAGLGIDPASKSLVFSDSLDFARMIAIHQRFAGRARMAFGIGTNICNDVGQEALNIVLKLVRANGQPVAKISDEPGKSMCEDPEYLHYLAKVHEIDLAS